MTPQAKNRRMLYRAYVQWFDEIGIDDVPLVGGKNASLGEMYRELASDGCEGPNGFAITAEAYRYFLRETGVDAQSKTSFATSIRAISRTCVSAGLAFGIRSCRRKYPQTLSRRSPRHTLSCRRMPRIRLMSPCAAARRLRTCRTRASRASRRRISMCRAATPLLHTCRRCFASLFTDRAISYRADKGFDHHKIALSIGVQRMVRADLGASGVMFTIDTETGFRDAVLINAAYGLGENIVKGPSIPTNTTSSNQLARRPSAILQKTLGTKEFKLIYDVGGGKRVKNVPVPPPERSRFAISDDSSCALGLHHRRPLQQERGAGRRWTSSGRKDGRTGELFILQARPETVQSRKDTDVIEIYHLKSRGQVLITGRSVGEKIAAGPLRVIKNVESLHEFRDGEILVTDKTDPDWEPIMKKAKAIVTNRGGRTCHAAIVSRELGVPAIVGTEHGTDILRTGWMRLCPAPRATWDLSMRERCRSRWSGSTSKVSSRPKTKVMMNVGNPEEAFALSFIPNDGVGLAREEFIITTYIKAHPLALLDYDKLGDAAAKAEIDKLTAGYADKAQFFVDKLAQGVAMIAAAFYPKDVILRLSDFKTNEYANLIGGRPTSRRRKPMIGFRGASRYYNPRYQRGFALECAAVKKSATRWGSRISNSWFHSAGRSRRAGSFRPKWKNMASARGRRS